MLKLKIRYAIVFADQSNYNEKYFVLVINIWRLKACAIFLSHILLLPG